MKIELARDEIKKLLFALSFAEFAVTDKDLEKEWDELFEKIRGQIDKQL